MKNIKNKWGFTLTEVMIVCVMISLVAAAIASYLTLGHESTSQLRAMQEMSDLLTESSSALDDIATCKKNFLGQKLGPTNVVNVNQLVSINSDDPAASPKVLTTVGIPQGHITPASITLKVKQTLDANRAIANLQINATRIGRGVGPMEFSRSLAIFVVTDSSQNILMCYGVAGNGGLDNFAERYCGLASSGFLYYNLKTNQCEDRYIQSNTQGTLNYAKCPAGTATMAKPGCGTTFTENVLLSNTRTYTSGTVINARPPKGFICKADIPTLSASCYYALDANTSGAKCIAKCMLDNSANLLAAGQMIPE